MARRANHGACRQKQMPKDEHNDLTQRLLRKDVENTELQEEPRMPEANALYRGMSSETLFVGTNSCIIISEDV